MRTISPVMLSFALIAVSNSATAANFYVDSPEQLMSQIDRMESGDKVVIRADGDYGTLRLDDRNFMTRTHIKAAAGVNATFDTISLTRCSNLRLTGVRVRPTTRTTAVYIDGGHAVEVYNSDIAFTDSNHDWGRDDWNTKTESGILSTASGSHHRFVLNRIHSVNHGIEIWSDSSRAEHNHINQFKGRGIRIFANHVLVRNNLITNNQQTDGVVVAIQSMTQSASGTNGGGVLTGARVGGNLIIESTYPNKAFPGMLQGIAFFDGVYEDYRIYQNVVVVDHVHGISLYGSDGSYIYQNTVVDAVPGSGGTPWIRVGDHKNGTVNINTRAFRNLTASTNHIGAVRDYDNVIIGSSGYQTVFRDHQNHDWRLTDAAPSNRGATSGKRFIADTLASVAAPRPVGASMGSRQACDVSPMDPLCEAVLADLGMVTLGNTLKWHVLRSVEGQFNFAPGDRMVDFADENGLEVRGHTLVWTQGNPDWLEAYRGDSYALESIMREHIHTVITRYKNRNPGVIRSWDVVNEPFYSVTGVLQKPEHRIWAGINSDLGHDQYIRIAYEEAHQADPDAHLVINDYNIISGPKADGMFDLVDRLTSDGVPIHGVGFQLHYDLSDESSGRVFSVDELRSAIRRYAAIGVKAHITELSVRVSTPVSAGESARAGEAYFNAARACAQEPNCGGLTMWDFSSADTFINGDFPGHRPELLLDDGYQRTSHYWSVMEGLR